MKDELKPISWSLLVIGLLGLLMPMKLWFVAILGLSLYVEKRRRKLTESEAKR